MRVFVSSIDLDVNVNVGPRTLPLGAIRCDTINSGERIRGSHRSPPADHVSIVVVMGWLDKDKLEASPRRQNGLQH